jgi:hypothetical protein
MQAVRAAEKVARYRHAQLSAIKLAGDINAEVTDSASLDELIAKLKGELHKLAPIIDTLRASTAAQQRPVDLPALLLSGDSTTSFCQREDCIGVTPNRYVSQ